MPDTDDNADWAGRVLLVVDRSAFARFGRMFRHLGFALHEEGVHPVILTDDPDLAEDLVGTPVPVELVAGLSGWPALWLERNLRRRFPRPPDRVHLWGTPALRTISHWTQRNRTPLLIHITGDAELATIARRGHRPGEIPVALCGAFAEHLGSAWNRSDPPVVGPGLLHPERISEDPPRGRTIGVLWAGNCDQHSGLPVLIEAVGRIPVDEMDVQVAVVGDGPELDDVWKRIRGLHVADRFSLIGGTQLWDQAIPGVDVCVVTARQNPLRLAPLLAMAHGKLVLATDDQVAEWFVPETTCVFFPAGDATALASLLRRYRDGQPNLLAIRRAARQHVAEHYPVTASARALAELYREAVV